MLKFLMLGLTLSFGALSPLSVVAQVEVYLFLREDCVISQHYTLDLRNFHAEYASDSLSFIGVFPNQSSSEMDMLIFKGKYEIPFEVILDHDQILTKRFGATVTPEVVVYDKRKAAVLYQGRIDDTYYRVGKKRRLTTMTELKDALEAIRRGEAVEVVSVAAIGCFIERG